MLYTAWINELFGMTEYPDDEKSKDDFNLICLICSSSNIIDFYMVWDRWCND